MKVDFFDNVYIEPARSEIVFGVCDAQDGEKAYTDIENEDTWIAKVKNSDQLNTVFTPIDNCLIIFKDGTKDKESTCDGMLTFQNSLFLIELKNQRANWITKAKAQLINTIRLLSEHHDIFEFRYKKAYACNKKHPYFCAALFVIVILLIA